ncbi:hypothetical protein V5799_025040 [Amblyomma americanum]|uniref:Uncharacterized protein n=1 Tax=Amblyomma americanum TaxID=6943 RepID=A0AAQ4EAG6_AMBAM
MVIAAHQKRGRRQDMNTLRSPQPAMQRRVPDADVARVNYRIANFLCGARGTGRWSKARMNWTRAHHPDR